MNIGNRRHIYIVSLYTYIFQSIYNIAETTITKVLVSYITDKTKVTVSTCQQIKLLSKKFIKCFIHMNRAQNYLPKHKKIIYPILFINRMSKNEIILKQIIMGKNKCIFI